MPPLKSTCPSKYFFIQLIKKTTKCFHTAFILSKNIEYEQQRRQNNIYHSKLKPFYYFHNNYY